MKFIDFEELEFFIIELLKELVEVK